MCVGVLLNMGDVSDGIIKIGMRIPMGKMRNTRIGCIRKDCRRISEFNGPEYELWSSDITICVE